MEASQWTESTLRIPAMDCPTEEQMLRMAVAGVDGVGSLAFDLPARRLVVVHAGSETAVLAAIERTGLKVAVEGSRVVPAPAGARPGDGRAQSRVLIAVLSINAAMFVIELVAGLWAESAGLLADSLDMLADASVYAIALFGAGAALPRQRRAARTSGWVQLGLSGLLLAEVVQRFIEGGVPRSGIMLAAGVLALLANVTCLVLLAGRRSEGAHMRASWIFTANDVLAGLGLIVASQLVAATGSAWPDLLIGTAIALLVALGAVRILRVAR